MGSTSDYYLTGISSARNEAREWVMEHMPPSQEPDIRYVREKDRDRIMRERYVNKAKTRARIPLKWRRKFCEQWKIHERKVVAVTNLILGNMEQSLADGTPIHIAHFGTFHIRQFTYKGRTYPKLLFRPNVTWMHDINEPRKVSDMGLKYKLDSEGNLTPRHIPGT